MKNVYTKYSHSGLSETTVHLVCLNATEEPKMSISDPSNRV